MTHSRGITLSRDARSWNVVSNPHRDNQIAPRLDTILDSDHMHAIAGGTALGVGAVAAAIPLVIGAPMLVAVLCAVLLGGAAWAAMYRILARRSHQAEEERAQLEAAFGPTHIMRGHIIDGGLADEADQLVMASASVLSSTAFREGALGHPDDAYADVMSSTWALLWRLVQLDQDSRQLDRRREQLEQMVGVEALSAEVDYLENEHQAVYADIHRLVEAQVQLAEQVAALDRDLAIPDARSELIGLTRSRIDDLSPQNGAEGLDARVQAAQAILGNSRRGPEPQP